MSEFDEKIKKIMKKEIEKPLSYEYAIKNAFYRKETNKYRNVFFKIATTMTYLIMGCTVVMASTYIIYDKIWKVPREYNNYDEYLENDKFASHNVANNIETNKAVDKNFILELSNKLIFNLNYKNVIINLEDIKEDLDNNASKYLIKKDNLEIIYNSNGEFKSFVDYNNDEKYDINPDKILIDDAILYANKIKDSLNLKNNYKIKKIQEISSYFENSEKRIWYVRFNKFDNEIVNNYQNIDIYFYLNNNNLVIEKILYLDDISTFGYEYQNNEIIISKESALETALEKNKELTDLEINNIEVDLAIKDMNAFIYSQELSNGTDDEIAYSEKSDGVVTAYNKYASEYILRNVWEVKISYIINSDSKEKVSTWKENFGRNYYIDATTGEIIGGAWGEEWKTLE